MHRVEAGRTVETPSHQRRRIIAALGLGLSMMALAACGGGSSSSSSPAPSSSGGSPAASAPAAPAGKGTVNVANSSLGKILVGPNGMTLYTYTADVNGKPDCNSACLALWPPLLATGTPTAGPGVTGKLGTVKNMAGQTQVTYNGQPLYYYVVDKQAGQTTGQGVKDALGVWNVAKP
jgi:predicted lipoprotein with Yx(FWY)xxD motif